MAPREAITQEIRRMLDLEFTEHSSSEWASPAALASEPSGPLRFCADLRKANVKTSRGSYLIPQMDGCIDSLGEAAIFSTAGCDHGCCRMPAREEDQRKAALTIHDGLYRLIRMPFGLKNARAAFQRATDIDDIILAECRRQFCLACLDDADHLLRKY